MIGRCEKCGLEAKWQPGGRNQFQISMPVQFGLTCPAAKQKMADTGKLEGGDMSCPDLSRSIGQDFDRWKARNGIR
jgi:hypothetical protein